MIHELKIILYGQEHIIYADSQDSILLTAKAEGIEPPYSCQMGVCSTCKAKLIEGEVVEQESSDALTEAEIANNYILTCISTPKSQNITINYDD
jgi:ring-1,2-phenylacetyl-CoA epoxidase subunit PaaE